MPATTKAKKSPSKRSKKKAEIPYHRKPDNLTLDQWQIGLRKQFAQKQDFRIENVGSEAVFSDFEVHNPQSGNTYKVAIRSNLQQIQEGDNQNFCSCYDFKTNGLGTCKHIESVLQRILKKRNLKKILARETFDPAYSSVYLKYSPQKRIVKLRIGSLNNAEFTDFSKLYFTKDGTIKDSAFDNFEMFLKGAREIDPGFRCYEDALSYIITIREKRRRMIWVDRNKKELQENRLSDYIKANLHFYQKEGVCFAIEEGRVMIADEMGLGKTLQAIAAAEVFKKEFGIQRTLVVCPTSLKYQWKSEIEKFTDSTVQVIEGNPLKRAAQYADDTFFYKIASHHTIGNDLDPINQQEFDLIILDEAQRIKNWKTKISQNIKKLDSPYVIVLSGTPLENRLEELYSVVQFIDPFRLGALFRFLYAHQVCDTETDKVIGYKDLNQIGEILSDILIRRTKKKVLRQLPSRQDKNLFVPMTREQEIVHNECYESVCRLVNKWRRMGFLPEKDRQKLMINLNMMRMVCDSTFILDQKTRHDTKIGELMGILEEVLAMPDEKVVIFSQWERMTRLVARELDAMDIKYENLHGGIPSKDRKVLLDNFREDPDSRVFLSTDAGGVGLNLQAAAYLINLDIPWNPAVLEQRIARIYRIGQKKKVNIINLVSNGTIEHKMLDVLSFKSSMAEGVLDGGDDTIMLQEDRFKKFMQSVETVVDETVPEPMAAGEAEESEDLNATYQKTENTGEKLGFDGKQMGLFDGLEPAKTLSQPSSSQMDSPAQKEKSSPDWLKQMAEAFANPHVAHQLARNFTEKNPQTGETYLKIPVENEKVVENVLNSLGQLFKAMDWGKGGE